MKRTIVLLCSIVLMVFLGLYLFGCGSNPTGGGGSGGGASATGPNTGTVSGHVYSYNETQGTFSGVSCVTIFVSTEAMSMEVVASSDANGEYTLTGLPAGKIPVTFQYEVSYYDSSSSTEEVYHYSDTIIADSNTFNFVTDYTYEPGTATIKGTVEGIPAGVTSAGIGVYALSGKNYGYTGFLDASTGTFEITGAPDDGMVYVRAFWDSFDSSTDTLRSAYNRTKTDKNGTYYLSLSFAERATLEASLTLPANFDLDFYTDNVPDIYNGHMRVGYAGGQGSLNGSTWTITDMAPLLPGDSYTLYIYGDRLSGSVYNNFYKVAYGLSVGQQNIDLSNISLPPQLIVSPVDGTQISGTPSIEWTSVPGATDYYVMVVNNNVYYEWDILTTDTQLTLPYGITSQLVPGCSYSVYVYADKYVNSQPINLGNVGNYDCYMDYELGGETSFTWNGFGTLSVSQAGHVRPNITDAERKKIREKIKAHRMRNFMDPDKSGIIRKSVGVK